MVSNMSGSPAHISRDRAPMRSGCRGVGSGGAVGGSGSPAVGDDKNQRSGEIPQPIDGRQGPSRFTTIDFARCANCALQRPKMSHILTSGTAAPDFMLHVTPDQILSLRDLAGKPAILAFYPAD